jgi:hypothetical protein
MGRSRWADRIGIRLAAKPPGPALGHDFDLWARGTGFLFPRVRQFFFGTESQREIRAPNRFVAKLKDEIVRVTRHPATRAGAPP